MTEPQKVGLDDELVLEVSFGLIVSLKDEEVDEGEGDKAVFTLRSLLGGKSVSAGWATCEEAESFTVSVDSDGKVGVFEEGCDIESQYDPRGDGEPRRSAGRIEYGSIGAWLETASEGALTFDD